MTVNDNVRLWKLQYDLKPKPSKRTPKGKTAFRFRFAPGDSVHMSHLRSPFMREYEERWTLEHFVVDIRGTKEGIKYYTLKDTLDEPVQGTFYESELSKVSVDQNTTYRVEKVLRKRRNEAFDKWMGWPSKLYSWITIPSLKDYKNQTSTS